MVQLKNIKKMNKIEFKGECKGIQLTKRGENDNNGNIYKIISY